MQTTILILGGCIGLAWALGVLWVGWFLFSKSSRRTQSPAAGWTGNLSIDEGTVGGDARIS